MKGGIGRDLKVLQHHAIPSPSYHEQRHHPLEWIGYPQLHRAACSSASLPHEFLPNIQSKFLLLTTFLVTQRWNGCVFMIPSSTHYGKGIREMTGPYFKKKEFIHCGIIFLGILRIRINLTILSLFSVLTPNNNTSFGFLYLFSLLFKNSQIYSMYFAFCVRYETSKALWDKICET